MTAHCIVCEPQTQSPAVASLPSLSVGETRAKKPDALASVMISKTNYKQQISVKVWTVSFYSFTVSRAVYRCPVPEFVFNTAFL